MTITGIQEIGLLSLYSTATQKDLRWVLALAKTPNGKFRFGNTNMLVSKNAKICVTLNAKPQSESVEYGLCWVPYAKFSRWSCTFNLLCVDFIRVGSLFSVEYGF